MIEDELIPGRWKIGIALSGHKKQKPSPAFIPLSLVPVAQETWHLLGSHVPSIHAFIEVPQADVIEEVIPCLACLFGIPTINEVQWSWLSCQQTQPMWIMSLKNTMRSISSTSFSSQRFYCNTDSDLKKTGHLKGKAQRTYLGIVAKSREDGRKCLPHILTIPAHLIHHQGWKPHGGLALDRGKKTPQNHWGSIFNTSSKVRCLNHWTTKKRRKGGCLLHEFGCKR